MILGVAAVINWSSLNLGRRLLALKYKILRNLGLQKLESKEESEQGPCMEVGDKVRGIRGEGDKEVKS